MFAESRPEVIEDMRQAADELRDELAGDLVTFVVNRNINVSNICTVGCAFCGFGGRQALARRLRALARRLRAPRSTTPSRFGATEICMQSGIHPDWGLEDYLGWLRLAKETAPEIHLHAYSPMEVAHMCDVTGLPPHAVFEQLREAGPGQRPRHRRRGPARRRPPAHQPEQAARRALGGDHHRRPRDRPALDRDRDVRPHRDARRAGRAHARGARRCRTRTGGFTEFVPLSFIPFQTLLGRTHGIAEISREENLKHTAVFRLALGQDDPVAAGELGQDGPRRRHRGAALGRQRPRRDADGGVDQPDGGRRPRRQARPRATSSPPPTAPAAPRPSARRSTASAATTTSPPRRDELQLGPLLRHAGDRRGDGVGADRRRRARSRSAPAGYAAASERDVHRRGPPLRARPRHRAAARRRDAVRGRARRRGRVAGARQRVPAERPAHAHARGPGADRLRLLPRRRAARAAAHAAQGRAPGRAARSTRCAGWRCACATSRRRSGRTRCCCSATRSTPTRSTRTSRTQLDGDGGRRPTTTTCELYIASWGEPVIRWLLSTVPSAMIFDDHDVHDDWNTSIEWVTEMRQKDVVAPADRGRLRELLHLPAPREPLAGRARRTSSSTSTLRTAEDPTPRLREFARRADEEVEGTRWSFCRDIGPARVVMIDSRAGPRARPGQPLDGRPGGVGVDRGARAR